ncbi:FAD-dependent oxidoreductase [Coraliomargarita sp. SDUM461004]|uniref:FAD-dependent oxidoreductase n=1 Tax=Thalassobacterium sedimentorum TaxID=3041258 RepID=A0ABU1AFX9_9BACT|nr:FAD-dependent oxidoreductase [Coraliomargarita sp. SDUM461004]MDQ8193678.1 FAD-dependent oxidoreductase [Coraliomargarita sp. SDUM461004]
MNPRLHSQEQKTDVCVVGGGMTGLIAAVAAARRGAKVVLIHDRPVLGGNASSEVRMWICGAHGHHRKETGILEEIQLLNLKRNPDGNYSTWDSVLLEFAKMTPGLTTLLNCTCNDVTMDGHRITGVNAWQLTTQTWHSVTADLFIDCSGDSILAPLSGAEVRWGRESREVTGEPIAPLKSDLKTMGNTILLQLEETAEPQHFTPPDWAYVFDEESNLPSRVASGFGHNFWWLEIGGLGNTITDSESIYDELVKAAWGIWDYMKNRGPQAEKLSNWRLRWLGSLPGKRENRRYVGPHVLNQIDVEAGGIFDDIVAYGGWSMDDHHPAGLYYPGSATIFHPAPSPYGIPFRCLYSNNITNLFCAGRNISATHAALSSTRVMGTCSLLGQAVGTAAALCVEQQCLPAEISSQKIQTLQAHLMEDDCWLPGKTRPLSKLMQAVQISGSNGEATDALLDGHEREADKMPHAWTAPIGTSIELKWESPQEVECLRLIFDSNLNDDKCMPCRYGLKDKAMQVPTTMVRSFTVEIQSEQGEWLELGRIEENSRRLYVLPIQQTLKAVRWTGHSTWGASDLRVYSIEASSKAMPLSQDPPAGKHWSDIISEMPPEALAEPDHGLEHKGHGSSQVGA